MIPILEKQANLTGIEEGATCTAKLPARGVHHGLYLVCRTAAGVGLSEGEIEADIGKITLRLDGDVKLEMTAQALLDLDRYWFAKDGSHTVDGVIPIRFWRPLFPTAAERALLCWGMADVGSFTLEVEVLTPGGLTVSSIDVYCEIENAVRKLGRHVVVRYNPDSFAATGEQDISRFELGDAGQGILAMHFEHGSGQIDACTVRVNDKDLMQDVPQELNAHRLRQFGRTQQTGYFHADFSVINDKTGYLAGADVKTFRQKLDWNSGAGAPGNFVIYNEEILGLKSDIA